MDMPGLSEQQPASASSLHPATKRFTTATTSSRSSVDTSTTEGNCTKDTTAPTCSSGTLTKAYNLMMTPVNFITFILSLVLIDLRYSLQRRQTHSASRSWLPTWLHALIYRPYENERSKMTHAPHGQWHYHTKQKKLFKMEADEAFKFRNTMLFVLGVASLGGLAGLWYTMGYIAQRWRQLPSVHL